MGNQAGKEKLSKADVEFLKTNTRYDEDTIQQWFKGFMKDCPQGKLSPPMFIKIYSKCFPGGLDRVIYCRLREITAEILQETLRNSAPMYSGLLIQTRMGRLTLRSSY